MLGNLLGGIVRVVNAPLRAAETLMAGDDTTEDERIISKPLDVLAEALEEADKD